MKQEITSRERVQAAIDLRTTDRTPCALQLGYFPARHHNIRIVDAISDPARFVEMKLATFDELGGADLLGLVPPCLGSSPERYASLPVRILMPGTDLPPDVIPQFLETEVMMADEYPLLIEKGWKRFAREVLVPRVFPPGEYVEPPYFDDSKYRKSILDRDIAMIPLPIMMPFELLSFARSFEKFMVDLYRRPDVVLEALEVMMAELEEDVLANIDESTEAMNIPMNRQSCGFISPRFFEKFAFPHLLRTVKLLTDRDITIFFHTDQDWTKNLPYFKQFPAGRYLMHIDGMTDIFEGKRILGDKFCFMGDVPARMFRLGTPGDIEAYCKRLIDEVGKGGGLILGAG